MTSSVETRDVVWCDGVTVAGQDFRLAQLSALLSALGGAAGNQLGVGGGVRDATANPLKVVVATGLSVSVNPGFAQIPGTTATNAGAYSVTVDTAATLTCQTADLVNPRVDLVCMTVTDNGTSSSNAVMQVVTGTPAPSPAAPALPSNSIALCNVAVAANATSLSSGNLTDKRPFSVASGGIMPVLNSSQYPSVGGSSMYLHDISTGRLLRLNGSGVVEAPSTALFAPVTASASTVETTSTTYVTVVSETVITDGNTPVKATLTFEHMTTAGTTAGTGVTITCFRDTSQLGSVVKTCYGADAIVDGGSIIIPDFNPPAGTHSYAFKIANQGTGDFFMHNAILIVEAMSP